MPMPRLSLPRKLLIGAGVLAALYALAGFWLVPALARRGLHEYLEVKHARHYQVGDVRFNPFTLRLDVDRFAVQDADGQPLLSFGHLAADLQIVSVLKVPEQPVPVFKFRHGRLQQIAAELADILKQRAIPADDIAPEMAHRELVREHD